MALTDTDPVSSHPLPAAPLRRDPAEPLWPAGRARASGRPDPSSGACRGLLSPAAVRSGYLPRHERLDAALNRTLAALLLVAAAPLFLLLYLLCRTTCGGPVFYAGTRLGKDRRPFRILKFRTLDAGAAKLTAHGTLPKHTTIETTLGSYLRKTRMDELPQLVNILRGEMVFFGPRPVRPEIEHIYAVTDPAHAGRFRVRPGLVGLSQALMPHGTPKKVRGRFNRMCCAAPIRYGALSLFLARVGLWVVLRSIASLAEAIRELRSPVGAHTWLRSGFRRLRNVRVEGEQDGRRLTAALCGVSDEVIQMVTTLPPKEGPARLEILARRRHGRQLRIAVEAEIRAVYPMGVGQSGFIAYATYTVPSDYTRYRIERYLLDLSVLPA
ncbi:sugar transferase [Mesobaculum littorinae]|uniref:Sugar transferase n=1 Tax=Mesobaculum littorinae TaxID=2486419 RepID=A0A438AIE7_9RHOB|nr:sugar transferase [Mesobaculum littorinae]RVV98470.1 sugar transferase [Mesobaculum littorinae]